MSPARPVASGPLPGRLLPYVLIALTILLTHGLLLTNDGTIWDSWYLLNILETRNWATLHEFFGAVGIPLYGWLFRVFAGFPDIVAAFMWATFFCLLANTLMTYELVARLGGLSKSESLIVAVLAGSMPLFSAAQDFAMFFFIFAQALFLAGALLAVVMLDAHGWRRWIARALAVLAFYVSFANAALLVFYGCFYLLLFFRYRRAGGLRLVPALRSFVARYPEFLLLPPAAWAVRPLLTPQYGWYGHYNSPITNLSNLWPNFKSFFENALPYHFGQTLAWPVAHPLAAAAMAAAVLLVYRMGPQDWRVKRSALPTVHLVWFGAVALFLAVFPFAAAGKGFSPAPLGENSRHAILAGVPLALLCLAVLRLLFLTRRAPDGESRWLPPIVACLALVLATQVAPVYLSERAQWIYSRAVLHQAVRNEAVRNSSVILLQGYSVVGQVAYALFGFASAFGELTRLVTAGAWPPENRRFYTPSEIERILLHTTLLPGNFRRIDPAGQQIFLIAERTRGELSDWDIASRYMHLRYFGAQAELDNYLASLIVLKVFVLKPATPLIRAAASTEAAAPAAGVATTEFANGAGMRMVHLPAGWWASKVETTQAQYRDLMGNNPSLFVDPARPVESVSWHEAAGFCAKVTTLEASAARLPAGFVYRLPTSVEFEYLAAGSALQNAVTSTEAVRWHSAPAASLPAGRNGLHDAFGNVWEWSLDWGDSARRLKVSNGGSWVDHAATLSEHPPTRLSGPLRKDYPDQAFWNRGFRCVLARAAADL